MNLSINSVAADAVSLRITEGASTLSGPTGGPYAIERSTNNLTFAPIASGLARTGGDVGTSVCDYVDRTVAPATTYYYRARYLDANGDSGSYASLPGPSPPAADLRAARRRPRAASPPRHSPPRRFDSSGRTTPPTKRTTRSNAPLTA